MRVGAFVIGLILIIGGIVAIANPRPTPMGGRDNAYMNIPQSQTRVIGSNESRIYGYASLAIGSLCAGLAYFVKFSTPPPHQ